MAAEKILMLTPFYAPNVGGAETHLTDMARVLQKKKIPTIVLTYQPLASSIKAPALEKHEFLEIHRISWPRGMFHKKLSKNPMTEFAYLFPGLFFKGFSTLALKGKEIKVIHAHGLSAGFATVLLSKIFKKKSIITLHTIYKIGEGKIPKTAVAFLNLADKILTVSKAAKKDLEAGGIKSEKIACYDYWVNQQTFKPLSKQECRKKLGIPEGKFTVLFVGRFTREKLAASVPKIALKCGKQFYFIMIGDGPLFNEVKSQAEKAGNVLLTGSVDNEKTALYYNAADVLLWGSIDEDYFGRVSREALSAGLPVITQASTEYFGIKKHVTLKIPEKIGFSIKPEVETAAKTLQKMEKNRKELAAMRKKCVAFARRNFSEKNAEEIIKYY